MRRRKNKKQHKRHKKQGCSLPPIPKFENQLRLVGLKIREITADGNCLFRAVSDQQSGSEDQHMYFRTSTVDYMMSHRDDFEPFVEYGESFDKYIARIKKDGAWGGNLELQALSQALKVNIHIHILDTPVMKIQNFSDDARTVLLSFHHGDHYNSVRMLNDDTLTPALNPNIDPWREAAEFVTALTHEQDLLLAKKFLANKFKKPPSLQELQKENLNIAEEIRKFQQVVLTNKSKCWCGSNRKYRKCCKKNDKLLSSNIDSLEI